MSSERDDRPKGSKEWRDERTMRTSAEPRKMWEAWTNPERLAGWFVDEARGTAEPGEEIVHVWRDFGMEVPHRVLEVDPGRRVLLEAMSPQGVPFHQEIVVEQEGGQTVLRLVHSGFGDDADWGDEYDGIDSGWQMAFGILGLYLERYFGRPRQSFLLMRPALFEFADAYELFTRASGLSRWLGESGDVGEAGSAVSVALANGGSLTGEVLAATGTEAMLSWSEIEGALELKAFPLGPEGRAVAMRVHSWHGDPERLQAARQALEPAFERLVAQLGAGEQAATE